MNVKTLLLLRHSARTRRYHVEMIRGQSVGEHSWSAATLVLQLWPTASRELIIATLYHDAPETLTGDQPSPMAIAAPRAKAELVAVEDSVLKTFGLDIPLPAPDRMRLKFADIADLVLYCLEERAQGNALVQNMLDRALHYAQVPAQFLSAMQDHAASNFVMKLGGWNDQPERFVKEFQDVKGEWWKSCQTERVA